MVRIPGTRPGARPKWSLLEPVLTDIVDGYGHGSRPALHRRDCLFELINFVVGLLPDRPQSPE
jgi:hypothetical protein